ncbi:MAG: glycoside hydrolase family 5 protein [Oscillospiraceae bacterium]|nr:glycoside hydrolase family 5 protein [Oscillospiraceae bacterium]
MKLKKIVALFATITMLATTLVFAGCGDSPTGDNQGNDSTGSENTGTDSENEIDGNGGTSQNEPNGEITHAGEPSSDSIRNATAEDVVAGVGAGWNLGNTFDARADSELSWIHHATTQTNIQAISDAGFDAIRIPVTWTVTEPPFMNKANPENDWTISIQFLQRVEEVVGWAYELGMTVIINSHHDDAVQLAMVSEPEDSDRIHRRIWEQVAGHFNNQFGERLIFAGSNEPRSDLSDFSSDGGDGQNEAINRQHQLFVDTVRATGGNNSYRSLIIMPHAASARSGALAGLQLPNDLTPNRLILAAHTYSPWGFSFRGGQNVTNFRPDATHDNSEMHGEPGGWWHHDTPERILYYFDYIQEHSERLGLPVLLTEWGSQDKNNTDARALHAEFYVAEARRRGWGTFWWDNMQVYGDDNEFFGLYDRVNNIWFFPEIVEGIMRGAGII